MGLDSDVLNWIRGIVRKAFRCNEPIDFHNACSVDDYLARVHRYWDGNENGWTGWMLFARFWSYFYEEVLQQGQATRVVVSVDISDLVWARKKAVHKVRDGGSASTYPPECEFGADGILLPQASRYVPFDLKRVLRSRLGCREKMMEFLLAESSVRRHLLGPNQAMYFDFSLTRGPVLLTRDYCGPMWLQGGYEKTDHPTAARLMRLHGESDLALPFWARVCQNTCETVYVQTVDADVLPIMLSYICTTTRADGGQFANRRAYVRDALQCIMGSGARDVINLCAEYVPPSLVWLRPDLRKQLERGSPEWEKKHQFPYEQIDLCMLAEQLLGKELRTRFPNRIWPDGIIPGMSLMQFLQICMLNKPDYVPKEEVANRVGCSEIIQRVLRNPQIEIRVDMPLLRTLDEQVFPPGECDLHYCSEQPLGQVIPMTRFRCAGGKVCDRNNLAPLVELLELMDRASYHGTKEAGMRDVAAACYFQLSIWLPNWNRLVVGDPLARYLAFRSGERGNRKRKPSSDLSGEQPPEKVRA